MACENKCWHRYTLESPVPKQKDKTESMVGGWKTKTFQTFPLKWKPCVASLDLRFWKVEDLLGISAHNAISDWVVFSVCGLWGDGEKQVLWNRGANLEQEGSEIWKSGSGGGSRRERMGRKYSNDGNKKNSARIKYCVLLETRSY